jgi:Glycosyl hydrolases family 16
MQRTSFDMGGRLDVSELIERINAERGLLIDDTVRHRLVAREATRRSRRRRLAPAIVGVATVLVVATIAWTIRSRSAPAAPAVDAALVGAASPSAPLPAAPLPSLGAAAGPTVPAPAAEAGPTVPASAAEAAPPAPPSPGRVSAAPRAAAPARRAPAVDDGVQAASARKWKLIDRDEFAGAPSPKWTKYDGEGNDGEGRRTPDAVGVRGGALVIRGDADGTTGGVAWRDQRETGRWEVRAKFPKGDAQYHPVLLLWPKKGGSKAGEIDFAETTSAASSVSFFLHHDSGDQKSAKKQVDLTQWHNYAVEVTSKRVTGYVDGQKWFESTESDTLPRGPVHPVIQLDWFPKGDSPEPSEMQVDWMRIYE